MPSMSPLQLMQPLSGRLILTYTSQGISFHKKKKAFPLLKLPIELRKKIYAFCLCDFEEIEARLRIPDPDPSPQPVKQLVLRHHQKSGETRTQDVVYPSRFLALLRVNRVIYEEALPFFYARNTFAFSDPKDLYLFTGSLAKRRRDLIKRVRVPAGFNVIGDRTVWDMMRTMKGLQQVSVAVPKRLWDAWGEGKPALQTLHRALAEGVELVIKIVTYSSEFGNERVLQEWVCRKGLEMWAQKVENEVLMA